MAVDYDPGQSQVIADPYPVFHRLQAEDPVHWSERLGGWVLTRYVDVKATLNDPRMSADRITPFLDEPGVHGAGTAMTATPDLTANAVGDVAIFAGEDPSRR